VVVIVGVIILLFGVIVGCVKDDIKKVFVVLMMS